MDAKKTTVDLWRELSNHYLTARYFLGGQPSQAFRAFVENLAAVLANWLQREQRKRKDDPPGDPDPLLELSELRVMADIFVEYKEKRDEGFSETKSRLLSALDLWWERFKQEHDSHA